MKVTDFRKSLDDTILDWSNHVNMLRDKHFILSRGAHIRKDGSTFPVEASLSYVIIDNE